jgi:hypothetical protein
MKTGIFRNSFLEDPWKGLDPGKVPPTRSADARREREGSGEAATGAVHNVVKKGTPVSNEVNLADAEGEIVLPDDSDDDDGADTDMVGLGDGIVEAAKGVSS